MMRRTESNGLESEAEDKEAFRGRNVLYIKLKCGASYLLFIIIIVANQEEEVNINTLDIGIG